MMQMRNFAGKEDTAFTVQYDFVGPKRFELRYVDERNELQEAVVVHRSSVGAVERMMAFLIERYEGAFPVWLSPVQVKVVGVGESHSAYCATLIQRMVEAGIRAESDKTDDSLARKVRRAASEKVPYTVVVGDREVERGSVAVRERGTRKTRDEGADDFIREVVGRIGERT